MVKQRRYDSFNDIEDRSFLRFEAAKAQEMNDDDLACEVLELWQRKQRCIYEIGKYLIVAKKRMNRGKFVAWIKDSFPFSYSTANSYMNVANNFSSPSVVKLFRARALYKLASPSIAESVRQRIVSSAKGGEIWTYAMIKNEVDGDAEDKNNCQKKGVPEVVKHLRKTVMSIESCLQDFERPYELTQDEEDELRRVSRKIIRMLKLL